MKNIVLIVLIIPIAVMAQSGAFGHGGGSSTLDMSTLLPIIADSTLWHLQGTDTLVTDGALPIKVSGIRVSGTARLDGTLTLITTAAESLLIAAGGIRNEGGLLNKGGIEERTKVVIGDSLRTEKTFRAKGASTFGATATPTLIDSDGQVLIGLNAPSVSSTIGLTIDNGDNNDNFIVLRSATVTHNMTGIIETSAFGAIAKGNAAGGGLGIKGWSETDIAGLSLEGAVNAFSSSANASVEFIARKRVSLVMGALASTDPAFKWYNHSTHLGTMLGNGNLGLGTTTPQAKLSVVGADGTGTGIHVVSSDVNLRRDTWAQANDTSSVTLRLDSVGDPRLFMAASDGDSARIHVRSDSTEFYSKNALVFDAPAVLIGASNVGISKMDTVFTAGYVPRWVKFTSGAKTWFSPVYADTTGKW